MDAISITALDYGVLGVLFIVIILVASGGGYILKKFVDQVIGQANKMGELADQSIAANLQTVIILKQIGDQLTKHDARAEKAINDSMEKLVEIRERVKV
jgi:septation ring formation regulator EzrA